MREVLRSIWHGWRAIALRIGQWQTRVILSLLYFVVIMPAAIAVRAIGDPLDLKGEGGKTRWRVRHHPTLSPEQARRQ